MQAMGRCLIVGIVDLLLSKGQFINIKKDVPGGHPANHTY